MKVILYMAISANGLIAKKDDNTSWISKEEWDSYSQMVREAGCMIVGHRTYDILTKQPEFSELKDVKLIVVSKHDFTTLGSNHVIAHSPKESLGLLENFEEVVVAGGGQLNASFLAENLIDEIYLDIEPRLLGEGIPIFSGKEFERNLKFIGQKQITEQEIQLHYLVIK
jgi:dihydrofolate reductase